MYYIEIEDLVTNALIELLERYQKRSISFEVLSQYGDIVVEHLVRNNKEVVALYSRDETNQFFRDYTDFFDVTENIITLKEGITVEQLKDKFRYSIAFDVFLAFISEDAIKVLKEAA